MEEIATLGKPVFDAVMNGEYMYAAALALVVLVAAARKYGTKIWPFLGTRGGALWLVLLGSFFGAIATALGAGQALSLALGIAAVKVAVGAAGGHAMIRQVLKWGIRKWPKLGAALKPIMWVFEKPADKAKEAGDKAVAENPSEGITGVIGEPEDIE